MKRAFVMVVVLSLFAVSLFAQNSKATPLTNARAITLEHVQGAWRMDIRCDQGLGSISMLDDAQRIIFLGEGCFANLTQEQMAAMYRSLLPQDSPAMEAIQLG